jgi:hypothetical protein
VRLGAISLSFFDDLFTHKNKPLRSDTMSEGFGFQKRPTEAITRRPSFKESLEASLKEGKKPGGNGFLNKRSSSGVQNKRWFVIHGHYLSYFKSEPQTEQVCCLVLFLYVL